MKKGLRSEKGSVTVFVLASCLFFLVSVIGVQEYTKNKQMAVEDDYRLIKLNYEKDIGNQKVIYENLKENEILGNITINFKEQEDYLIPTGSNTCVITQQFTIENRANKNIESISYGWSNNENTEPVNWEFISSQTLSSIARKTDVTEGDYYLWVKVIEDNNSEKKEKTNVSVLNREISISQSNSNAVITYPEDVYNKKVGQGENESAAKANATNNSNVKIPISSNIIYVEGTDSHGNKIYKSFKTAEVENNIRFYINGNPLFAEKNSTWIDWCLSDYNTIGAYLQYGDVSIYIHSELGNIDIDSIKSNIIEDNNYPVYNDVMAPPAIPAILYSNGTYTDITSQFRYAGKGVMVPVIDPEESNSNDIEVNDLIALEQYYDLEDNEHDFSCSNAEVFVAFEVNEEYKGNTIMYFDNYRNCQNNYTFICVVDEDGNPKLYNTNNSTNPYAACTCCYIPTNQEFDYGDYQDKVYLVNVFMD